MTIGFILPEIWLSIIFITKTLVTATRQSVFNRFSSNFPDVVPAVITRGSYYIKAMIKHLFLRVTALCKSGQTFWPLFLLHIYNPALKKWWLTDAHPSFLLSVPSVFPSVLFLAKFYVKDFSTTMQARMIIFSLQFEEDFSYCGIDNQHSPAYFSLYLSNYLSFQTFFHTLNNAFFHQGIVCTDCAR